MRRVNTSWCNLAAIAVIQVVMCGAVVFSEGLPLTIGDEKESESQRALLRKGWHEAGRHSVDYQDITGLLIDKSSVFSEAEKSHELEKRMCKFVIEHDVMKSGSVIQEKQVYFFYKCRSSLRGRLDAISIGDRITIHGRWELLESDRRTVREGIQLEQNQPMNIFIVDAIEG